MGHGLVLRLNDYTCLVMVTMSKLKVIKWLAIVIGAMFVLSKCNPEDKLSHKILLSIRTSKLSKTKVISNSDSFPRYLNLAVVWEKSKHMIHVYQYKTEALQKSATMLALGYFTTATDPVWGFTENDIGHSCNTRIKNRYCDWPIIVFIRSGYLVAIEGDIAKCPEGDADHEQNIQSAREIGKLIDKVLINMPNETQKE